MRAGTSALREVVEEERRRFGVPGVAVAVVHGGEVLLCEGFGVTAGDGAPVDERTAFPLASDTKAVTGTALALLHTRGALDLDAPVQETLPWFRLGDAGRSALVTTRDLLGHRTGLPRHDLVWGANPGADLEEVTRRVGVLDVNLPFRHAWQYTNLGYVAAGHVAESATGTRWDDLVQELVLSPLGMADTGTTVRDDQVLALPHRQLDGAAALTGMPVTSAVRPAGGLVTTAADLSRWLLGRLGAFPEALTPEALAEAQTPAVVGGLVPTWPERHAVGYALGSQVEVYRGHRLLHHGGNLMGYASNVCVLPDAGIGVAVLSNLQASALRNALPLRIVDDLLALPPADWGGRYLEAMRQAQKSRTARDAVDVGAAHPDPTGSFAHPAYGRLRVEQDQDGVVARLSELPYPLRVVPEADGRWALVFDEFDQHLPFDLELGAAGTVTALVAQLEPTVAAIRFTAEGTPAPAR